MHDQYIRSSDSFLKKERSCSCRGGTLKAETECEIIPAQDQELQTKHCASKILQTKTDGKCRLCQQFQETTDHIISACQVLEREQYKRHDSVFNYTLTYARKRVKPKISGVNIYQNE